MSTTSWPYACPNCRAQFDVLAAPICDCVGNTRTFVCPSCNRCFCRAAGSVVSDFWKNAPEEVWARRTAFRDAVAAAEELPEAAYTLRPLVLIVDDDPVIGKIAQRVIAGLGYGILVAKNGEEGLATARDRRPDVVIADALMPKLDGREMCRRLREDPETGWIRTIVMSGVYTGPKAKTEAIRQYGVDEFLAKPLALAELTATLSKLVGPPLPRS